VAAGATGLRGGRWLVVRDWIGLRMTTMLALMADDCGGC